MSDCNSSPRGFRLRAIWQMLGRTRLKIAQGPNWSPAKEHLGERRRIRLNGGGIGQVEQGSIHGRGAGSG